MHRRWCGAQRQLLATFGLPINVFAVERASLEQVAGPQGGAALLDEDRREQVAATLAWLDEPETTSSRSATPPIPQGCSRWPIRQPCYM